MTKAKVPLLEYCILFQGRIPQEELDFWRSKTVTQAKRCIGLRSQYDIAFSNCEAFVSLIIALTLFIETTLPETDPTVEGRQLPKLSATMKTLTASLYSGSNPNKPSQGIKARHQTPDEFKTWLNFFGVEFLVNKDHFRTLRDQLIGHLFVKRMNQEVK